MDLRIVNVEMGEPLLAYGFSEFFLYLQFKCFHRVQLILPQNQLLPTMCNINMPQPKISIPLQISRSVCLVRSADLSSQLKLLLLAYRQCYRQDSVLSFSFPFDTKPSISLFPSEVGKSGHLQLVSLQNTFLTGERKDENK